MTRPVCRYGYTPAQIAEMMGTREPAFWKWYEGQTGAICDGRVWDWGTEQYVPSKCLMAHGPVVYPWDVAAFLSGQPARD